MKTNGMVWFDDMVKHCYGEAQSFKQRGVPIVRIMCEYTPR